jgi:hypothetical protein
MQTEEIVVIAIFKARGGKEVELIERLKSNHVANRELTILKEVV